ncbi:peptidylprolyl isomerase [Undibacterium sp. Di24W]|uniref:peptidylprolyl isomerase n=1 Tax=Undibacterium sp. Di24W TaxID=3413033 RepID=UPI003BF173B6
MVGVGTVPVVITDGSGNSLYASNVSIPLAAQPQVTVVTNQGTVVLELNPAKAPITVDNFLSYTETGFYVNKIFHRVIKDFMIQGGGFSADLTQAVTQAPIKLEVGKGLSNIRGSIAMARTSVLDSATSQFFINVVDNLTLDTSAGGYAVFGKVVSGLDVVDKIKVVPTSTRGGMADVPDTAVVINSMLQTQ